MAQKLRYSDSELQLIKKTFSEQEPVLKIIRKVMLQLPLNENEEKTRKAVFSGETMKVIRKTFLPEISGEESLGQVVDLWSVLQIENQIVEAADLFIQSRDLTIKYLKQQLEELEGNSNREIIFESFIVLENKTREERYIELVARNYLLTHIESQLNQLNFLAEIKDETPEQTAARLKANSSK